MSYIPDVIQRNGASRMSCISIRMPAGLVAELDAEAQENGCSTSQVVRELLRLALDVRHDGR
jgi:metal-responsive CopG/Arc/MetJ family transcriptional regulator